MRVRKEEILLPNGTVEDYFLWEQGDIVIVVPMTVDGLFLLVEQYKHGARKFLVEFPGVCKNQVKPQSPQLIVSF